MGSTFSSATASTRRAKPSHKSWEPTNGQLEAVDHLVDVYSALLVADPGAGKTAISLAALCILNQEAGRRHRMLVIAPLRVCQLVWRQEGEKWTQFRHLKFSMLHGPRKAERLKDDADVFLINPEGVMWLAEQFFGRSLPFDIVNIDQTTKFKNSRAVRFKKLRPRLNGIRRRWGLTGALIPNGYMDLFGQMLILDDGAALGPYITHYRDKYFQTDYTGFDYTLQPGAAARIEARIRPYIYRLPYTELPPLVDDPIFVELEPAERELYETMKKDMIVELESETVTAANAAAVYSKLKQMANGAVYVNEAKEWVVIHDRKIEALAELIEDLQGAPLFIGYEFRHDLERLQKRWPDMRTFDGLNEKEAIALMDDWNANKLPYIAAHPASVAHGLNLQQGAASHIAWFSPTVDYDLYDEFTRRLRRRGNEAERVINHLFLAKDTVDDTLTLPAIRDKGLTQSGLLARLAEELGVPATGISVATNGADTMQKLSRQGGTTTGAAPAERPIPKGWGKPAAAEPQQQPAAEIEQRQAVTRRLAPQTEVIEAEEVPASVKARAAFSAGVRGTLNGAGEGHAADAAEGNTEAAAPAKRTRTRKPADPDPVDNGDDTISAEGLAGVRLSVLEAVITATTGTDIAPEDILDIAKSFVDFVLAKE